MLPAKLIRYPASAHRLAIAASPEKQWNIDLFRRSLGVQDPQHVLVRLPVVDHQRLAGLLGDRRCARGTTPAAPRAGPSPGSSRGRSPRWRARCGSPASAAISASTSSAGRSGRGRPCGLVRVDRHRRVHVAVLVGAVRPPTARSAGRRRSLPPWRSRPPAPRPAPRGTGRSIRSRWQWLSRASAGSGSGRRGWRRSRLLQPGQLLVGKPRVELGEQRRGRLQRRARPDRLGLPPRRAAVVAGDHRVRRTALLGDLLDPRHRRPGAGAAEHLVHLLRRARQERGE